MIKSIQAELYKLFKNRAFKVLMIIAILLAVLTIFMGSKFFNQIIMDSLGSLPEAQKEMIMKQMTSLSNNDEVVMLNQIGIHLQAKDIMNPTAIEIFHASFGSGVIEILIGILVGGLLAKEYSQGTIKNFLAYGKRREEFYLSKFISIVIAITPTIICTLFNGWGQSFEISQVLGMIKTFIVSLMASSAVASLIMVIAILVKSNGATIGISVAIFTVIPLLVGFLYGIYPWFDRIYEVLPFYNSALATSIKAGNVDLIKSTLISLITIIISLFTGIKLFKSQDIK